MLLSCHSQIEQQIKTPIPPAFSFTIKRAAKLITIDNVIPGQCICGHVCCIHFVEWLNGYNILVDPGQRVHQYAGALYMYTHLFGLCREVSEIKH